MPWQPGSKILWYDGCAGAREKGKKMTLTECLLKIEKEYWEKGEYTLGDYRRLAVIIWGELSGAVKFVDENISKSPKGADEKVLASNGQMIYLLDYFNRHWS